MFRKFFSHDVINFYTLVQSRSVDRLDANNISILSEVWIEAGETRLSTNPRKTLAKCFAKLRVEHNKLKCRAHNND